MDRDGAQVTGLDQDEVEARFLGKLLGKEALAASGRAIEQHAVGRREAVFCGELFIFQDEDDALAQHLLEVIHAGNVGKSVAAATLDFHVGAGLGSVLGGGAAAPASAPVRGVNPVGAIIVVSCLFLASGELVAYLLGRLALIALDEVVEHLVNTAIAVVVA